MPHYYMIIFALLIIFTFKFYLFYYIQDVKTFLSWSMIMLIATILKDFCPQFSSVQSLSHVRLFVTPCTAACQASLSITNSRSLLTIMSIESVMASNHLILCRPLLLPPSIFLSLFIYYKTILGLPLCLSGKESACQCRRHGFQPRFGKITQAVEQLSPCVTIIEPVL